MMFTSVFFSATVYMIVLVFFFFFVTIRQLSLSVMFGGNSIEALKAIFFPKPLLACNRLNSL